MPSINERLASLETSVSDVKEVVCKDIKDRLGKIFDKLDNLPCAVHNEKFKGLDARMNWLYFAFVVVVLGGIVLGLWLKYLR